jgi:mono/diheme cytochrome c family protein
MRRGILLLLVLIAIGCATAVVQPTREDVTWASTLWPETTLEDLQRGRTLYVGKCAGCHHLHRPDEYSADRWRTLVDEMRKEAKVSEAEGALILKYLSAASTRLRNPPMREPASKVSSVR